MAGIDLKKNIKKLKPYNPGIFSSRFKMDANENSYDIPAPVKKKIIRKIEKLSLNRYPDPLGRELKKKLSKKLKASPSSLFLGNGSDEIIYYLTQAFIEKNDRVIVPVPTFEMYGIISVIGGAKVTEIPLDKNFDIDDKKIISRAKNKKVKFIFIAYPNNPTGNCFSELRILRIIKNVKCFVVLDEAYYEFSGKTFINRLNKFRNLIVLRTFSKAYSMAGLRVGYMIAAPDVVDALNRVRLPYNVNAVSQLMAKEALSYAPRIQESICGILNGREKIYAALKDKHEIIPSDSNFLLIKVRDGKKAKRIFRKKRISVRFFEDRRLKNYVRVTAGKPEENRAVIKILSDM